MINQIIKDWVGEDQDEIKAHNESMEEKWRVLGYNQAKAELRATIPQLTERIEKEMEVKISQLRQWLNEDRIDSPKKMITNEDIKHWLEFTNHTLTREVREEI